MKHIQNAIIERGFVTTRVLAPPQDLNSGVLQLTLIPGRIHSIRFAEGTSTRANAWNAAYLRRITSEICTLRRLAADVKRLCNDVG
ncbi:POTRA domain-containing protein [Pseudomonas fluorescens]|uniref:POTRA domain-containing protein n=1 Tax=Pseudomonas fluorescens TaxID=294 RepID=UPI0039900D96